MREGSPPHTCQVSGVTCHMSRVMCHLSYVICHVSYLLLLFFVQSVEASKGIRVCYQRGLLRPVFVPIRAFIKIPILMKTIAIYWLTIT